MMHRLLGGATDESGRPIASENDWVEIFDGSEVDAHNARKALTDEHIESAARVYVPLGSALGVSADPRTVISVRAPDVDQANELVDAVPHLGRRQSEG